MAVRKVGLTRRHTAFRSPKSLGQASWREAQERDVALYLSSLVVGLSPMKSDRENGEAQSLGAIRTESANAEMPGEW